MTSRWYWVGHEVPIVLIQMHLLRWILLLLLGLEVLVGVHVCFRWHNLLLMVLLLLLLRDGKFLLSERIGVLPPVAPVVSPTIVIVIVGKCC